ncbi:MAG: prepilin-type N-terminal cleavage/methylation domain-containing protein [Gemmatimonadota bacterium]
MRVTPRGFVLVELVAALVITGLIGAALYRLVDRSQRFARGIALIADERAQLAVAGYAVEGAVQGIAPGDGDLLGGADSAVVYLGHVGSAMVCSLGVGGATLDVAAPSIASGASLTWWNTAPQGGDSLVVLDEGVAAGAADDRFVHSALVAVAPLRNACLTSPYLDSIADAGSIGWRLTPAAPLPATVVVGAVLRVLRPERFALYRSGSEWTMGWTEWNGASGGWNVIQPVAGPLLPYASSGRTSGFSLQWQDSTGRVLAPAPGVPARSLDLSFGAVTRQQVRLDGANRGLRRDSLTLRIPLRNAP